ncbi:hypothetical protein [Spirosoma pulveris]
MVYTPVKNSLCILSLLVFLQACSYSVIVSNKNGVAQADPFRQELGFYNLKKVQDVKLIDHLSLLQNSVMIVDSTCTEGFHSIEYKITFGDMLRNTFTFGKRKAVRVRIVCIKPTNQ